MKLSEIQEIAEKLNILVSKQGKSKSVFKTKTELIDEIEAKQSM